MGISYTYIKRWYLEMNACPVIPAVSFPEKTLVRKFTGTPEEYRQLNKSIGEDLGWVDRLIMPDPELAAILQDDAICIYVLLRNGVALGLTELNFRQKDIVELDYFGLIPQARGQGLGSFLLQWTIQEAWRHHPRKLILHTSERDHPRALPNYLTAGFHLVAEKLEKQAEIHG